MLTKVFFLSADGNEDGLTYCISDIHGEYNRYLAMLELIDFSDTDTLYVLGDVIDRGDDGVDILLDIMGRSNVKMLMGNHEYMCLATLGPQSELGARQLWRQNGGSPTYYALMFEKTKEERMKVIQFIQNLPDHFDIEVAGKMFHLVHGYPADNWYDRIWKRPKRVDELPMSGTTVIIGHTPTVFLTGDDGKPFRIWHGNGIIDIDCGCGKKTENRRLACLRLDDMREFYV